VTEQEEERAQQRQVGAQQKRFEAAVDLDKA
jgi:hypothetical protein